MNSISYVHGGSNINLLGQTIGNNLKSTVLKFPNNEALVSAHQNYRATYSEFYEQTSQVAKALIARGIEKGDRVGIWSPNRYEWVLLQFATARIGVILVNINPAYRAHEVGYAINQSGLKMMVATLKYRTSNYKQMIEAVRSECPTLKQVVYLDLDWDSFLHEAHTVNNELLHERETNVDFDEAINIQYTSGTTGFPKGVTLTHNNILNNGYFIGLRLNYTEKDRVCIPVPFYHCFGMVIGNLCCVSHGACMVIPSDGFDAETTLKVVEQEKCTSLYGVPSMFIQELNLANFADYDLTSLRTGVMAGSVCPEPIMKRVQSEMNMSEVTVCYGMTETSPVSMMTKIGAPLKKQVSTVGTIMDHLEVKIINPETQQIVKRGEPGELCTRGYSVMLKYWEDEARTKEVLGEDRWMHTGDQAIMDDEGYVQIVGRIKDLIIRGGENISPKWIEDYLYTHPAVSDVQVIGVPSDKYGEEIMAWIILKEGEVATEDELLNFCKGKIAHYRIPRYWKFVDSFPLTVSGKVRKIDMRQQAIEELGL